MKNRQPTPMGSHEVLRSNQLAEGQDFAARVWAKHKSHVVGDGGYDSRISRAPLGRSFLCHVDCRSPMHVEADGNKSLQHWSPIPRR